MGTTKKLENHMESLEYSVI